MGLCCVLLAMAATVLLNAQTQVRQGEVLRITSEGSTAELNHKTIRLFPQAGRQNLGLMPVPVTQAPGHYIVIVHNSQNSEVKEIPIEVVDAHYPRQNIRAGKAIESLTPLPGEMETVRALQNTVSGERLWAEPFTRPTPQCMNSLFGVMRYHNGKPTGNYHRGADLRSPMGTPVHAITPGVVRVSKMFRLHGGTIGIDHGQGVTSIYIHLSKLAAPEGTVVQAGDVVGYVGSTGFATGPHLHWQISVNGVPVNPSQWIPAIPRCQ